MAPPSRSSGRLRDRMAKKFYIPDPKAVPTGGRKRVLNPDDDGKPRRKWDIDYKAAAEMDGKDLRPQRHVNNYMRGTHYYNSERVDVLESGGSADEDEFIVNDNFVEYASDSGQEESANDSDDDSEQPIVCRASTSRQRSSRRPNKSSGSKSKANSSKSRRGNKRRRKSSDSDEVNLVSSDSENEDDIKPVGKRSKLHISSGEESDSSDGEVLFSQRKRRRKQLSGSKRRIRSSSSEEENPQAPSSSKSGKKVDSSGYGDEFFCDFLPDAVPDVDVHGFVSGADTSSGDEQVDIDPKPNVQRSSKSNFSDKKPSDGRFKFSNEFEDEGSTGSSDADGDSDSSTAKVARHARLERKRSRQKERKFERLLEQRDKQRRKSGRSRVVRDSDREKTPSDDDKDDLLDVLLMSCTVEVPKTPDHEIPAKELQRLGKGLLPPKNLANSIDFSSSKNSQKSDLISSGEKTDLNVIEEVDLTDTDNEKGVRPEISGGILNSPRHTARTSPAKNTSYSCINLRISDPMWKKLRFHAVPLDDRPCSSNSGQSDASGGSVSDQLEGLSPSKQPDIAESGNPVDSNHKSGQLVKLNIADMSKSLLRSKNPENLIFFDRFKVRRFAEPILADREKTPPDPEYTKSPRPPASVTALESTTSISVPEPSNKSECDSGHRNLGICRSDGTEKMSNDFTSSRAEPEQRSGPPMETETDQHGTELAQTSAKSVKSGTAQSGADAEDGENDSDMDSCDEYPESEGFEPIEHDVEDVE